MTTERLILRRWLKPDREPFARLKRGYSCNGIHAWHPFEARERFAGRPNRGGSFSNSMASASMPRNFDVMSGDFIGFIGFNVPSFHAAFTPCVEIGWRLAAEYWGQGLATEGAREVVRCGFEMLGLEELVSFTVPANIRSRHVMEKLGMTHDTAADFQHPGLPENHPLSRHVLYRLSRSAWACPMNTR